MINRTVENRSTNENCSDPKPSKTQRKKAMLALQQLGEQLIHLNDSQLLALNLPEKLNDAIKAAKQISKFGARKRQIQYIGKLIRQIDASDIPEKLGIMEQFSSKQRTVSHRTERWLKSILSDKNGLTEFAKFYSSADIQYIRLLIRKTLKETEPEKQAENHRLLFQVLQKTIQEAD